MQLIDKKEQQNNEKNKDFSQSGAVGGWEW
jgi:hypothetical protein